MHPRLTPHRKTVLAILHKSSDHPAARQVFERALEASPKISQATVYNTLAYLVDEGLIRKFSLGSALDRYEAITDRHDHVVCRECNQIIDVNLKSSLQAFKIPVPAGFWIEDISVTVTGLCHKCKNKIVSHRTEKRQNSAVEM